MLEGKNYKKNTEKKKMTKTIVLLTSILENKCQRSILEILQKKNETTHSLYNSVISNNINDFLNHMKQLRNWVLINHIHSKNGDYYNITARGKRILEIIKEVEAKK
jgi:predicted transcriptional regulator